MARDLDLTEALRQATSVKVTREGLEAMRDALLAQPVRYQPPVLSKASHEAFGKALTRAVLDATQHGQMED